MGDWSSLLSNDLQPEDVRWMNAGSDGGGVLDQARAVMSKGSIVEYECYDARGRPQGRALIRLQDWEDYANGVLKAEHLCASDPYYEWYGQHELAGGRGIYHLCSSKRTDCTQRLGRGDRRELVHLEKWRMTNPLMMMEHEFSKEVALKAVRNWVSNFTQVVPEPPGFPPGPPRGARGADQTGIDEELEKLNKEEEPPKEKTRGRAEPSGSEAKPRGSVGILLEKKAAERREALLEKDKKKKKKREERGRSRSRRGRRRRGDDSSSARSGGSDRSRSSESSRSFREPSTRGEVEMWRLSQRNPGVLLRRGMVEMGRYLADRAPADGDTEDWTSARMMAYISQVILPTVVDRGAEPSRVADPRPGDRLPVAGQVGRAGRPVDAEAESRGDVPDRSGVALSSAPRVDSFSRGVVDDGGREEEDRPHGVGSQQAQRDDREREKDRQIGTRRRCSEERGHRDATQKDERGRRSSGERTKGDHRRSSPHDRAEKTRSGSRKRRRRSRRERSAEDATLQEGEQREERKQKRRRKRKAEGRSPDKGAKPHAPEILTDNESFETVALASDAESTLDIMRKWLQSEETGGLSVAQTGALLALAIRRSGTPLGEYLGLSLVPGSDDGAGGGRQRSVLPLPLLEDSRTELQKLFNEGEFRRLAGSWANKKQNKEKAAKLIRKAGMLIWHALLVTALNVLWTSGGAGGRVCRSEPTKAQRMALDRLWERVRDFVDDSSETQEKVPYPG